MMPARPPRWRAAVVAAALAACLALSALGGAAVAAGPVAPAPKVRPFTVPDVVQQAGEDLLVRMDVLQGDGRSHYREDAAITRAEMATLMVRALGYADEARGLLKQKAPFADMAGHWAQGEVAMALQQKLMNGYPDGTFQPERFLSYAEALVVLERTLNLAPTDGAWPDNVMTAAAKAGLVRSELLTAIQPDAAALRGVLFVLVADALQRPNADGSTLVTRIVGGSGPRLAVPKPATETGSDHVSVTGTVYGALLVTVAGQPAALRDGTFAVDVPLVPGNNTFVILATDSESRQASQTLSITRVLYSPSRG